MDQRRDSQLRSPEIRWVGVQAAVSPRTTAADSARGDAVLAGCCGRSPGRAGVCEYAEFVQRHTCSSPSFTPWPVCTQQNAPVIAEQRSDVVGRSYALGSLNWGSPWPSNALELQIHSHDPSSSPGRLSLASTDWVPRKKTHTSTFTMFITAVFRPLHGDMRVLIAVLHSGDLGVSRGEQ